MRPHHHLLHSSGTRSARSPGTALAASIAGVALATGSSTAQAADRPCAATTDDEAVVVTWGTQSLENGDQVDFDLRRGNATRLSRKYDLQVQTSARRPYVCAGRTPTVSLPTPRRGQQVVAATVNGDYVAWRTSRHGRDGIVSVGRVEQSRATAVRRVRTPDTPSDAVRDGRILVTATGTATWVLPTISTSRNPDRAFVWPRGGRARPVTIPRDRASDGSTTVAFLDDQHLVFGESDVPKRFRPARPGRCPTLFSGTWRPLGRLLTAYGVGGAYYGERDGETWARILVCDPKTGTYRRVVVDSFYSSGIPGCPCSSGTTTTTLTQNGPWLAIERLRDSYNESKTYVVELTDTRTGRTRILPGAFQGPGRPLPVIPPSDVINRVAWTPIVPGVVARDGAIAWREGSPVGPQVQLSDARGERVVGPATGPRLMFEGDTLTWTDATGPRAALVHPSAWRPTTTAAPGPRAGS